MEAIKMTLGAECWESICKESELIDNVGICALMGNEQIAIFRLSGSHEIYAINNHDPFSGANVLSRGIVGDLKGQPVVASPIYKQHFNLQTGRCLEDETITLKTYPVRIMSGMVQLANAGEA